MLVPDTGPLPTPLNDRSRRVLLLRREGQSLKQVGQTLALSPQRISQIERRAIRELRYALKRKTLGMPVDADTLHDLLLLPCTLPDTPEAAAWGSTFDDLYGMLWLTRSLDSVNAVAVPSSP